MRKYDFKTIEPEIMNFWADNKIKLKSEKKNEKGKKFYFLQGPPYTSGRLHVGQAWNHALKDMALRFYRLNGRKVWDRGGYDMHGLPTAQKVMAMHNLNTKEDIQKWGLDKFIKECIKFSEDKVEFMNKDIYRLGVWMDLENSYLPIKNEFIENAWWLVKKAHENKRLYENYRPVAWDYVHQSALAKHELEYKTVVDKSVFLKFPVKEKKDEFLVIWTTTPWTIAFNLGIMVNPELEYVKAKVGKETWIIAKELSAPVINTVAEKKFTITETFKGEKLEGIEYEHIFYHQPDFKKHYDKLKQEYPKTHTVVLSKEYVTLAAGTGLVHMAPGCGPEDYEVGYQYKIPAWNNLNEDGTYPNEMGKFSGWHAKIDNDKFIDEFGENLIAATDVEHEYPYAERSHKPIIFRATKQWFFKVEDLKKDMLKANKDIEWTPVAAKNSFNSWLENLRDNSITKQRFWGTPVPIWRAEDEDIIVIENKAELEKLSGQKIDNLHKPWIDKIIINKNGKEYKRIPDILDVWIDAGTTSWNCLDYPREEKNFNELFPADLIIEGKDQIRGWFNVLMVCSFITMKKPSFKNVYMHGFVTDVEGEKMSKSLGNIISPYEIIDQYGADTLRYYFVNSKAGEDINFSWDEIKLKFKNLGVLWNVHNYLIEFAELNKIKPTKVALETEDKYILSKANSTIKKVTDLMNENRFDEVPTIVEDLFLEISRTYIQLVREKTEGTNKEKQQVLYALYESLLISIRLMSIITPFIAEQMYQNMKQVFDLKEESIHLFDWPVADKNTINKKLEQDFEIAKQVISAALGARDKAKIGVRWPLKEIFIEAKKEVCTEIKELEYLIKKQVNIKNIVYKKVDYDIKVKPHYRNLGKEFGQETGEVAELISKNVDIIVKEFKDKEEAKIGKFTVKKDHFEIEKLSKEGSEIAEFRNGMIQLNTTQDAELEREGFIREIIRRVQQLRKESGLKKEDRITLSITTDINLAGFEKDLQTKVGATNILTETNIKKLEFSKEESIKGKKIIISISKNK